MDQLIISLAQTIKFIIPLGALVVLLYGIYKRAIYYITAALWLSLISLIIHYQNSGGEILGTYFNYLNAFFYSLNLVILAVSMVFVLAHLNSKNEASWGSYLETFIKSLIFIACFLMFTNVWMNAFFIENKMKGTPIIQVALINKPVYCDYKYVFFKMAQNGSVYYLCPNYYGLIPKLGYLEKNPDFLETQLPLPSTMDKLFKHKGR